MVMLFPQYLRYKKVAGERDNRSPAFYIDQVICLL